MQENPGVTKRTSSRAQSNRSIMAFNSSDGTASAIQGQLLRLSARREVAIYLRDDTLWVADFIDGRGEITDARMWFRFNCASVSATHARHRMALESAIPLST